MLAPSNLVAFLKRVKRRYDDYPIDIGRYRKARIAFDKEFRQLRKHAPPVFARPDAEMRSKSSVVIASLPKSGTKYIGSTVARSLGLVKSRSLYKGTFPHNRVLPHMAAEFAKGGMASASHIRADPNNIDAFVENGLTKLVLHVRDPRACLYSWSHFYRRKAGLLVNAKPSPEAFLALPEARQIDHHIATFFADCLDWLGLWCDGLERDDRLQILVSSYDRLVADEDAFFKSIFDFYGVAPVVLQRPAKDTRTNFRSGDPNEWRHALSQDQIDRMTEMMPERLFRRFGWTA